MLIGSAEQMTPSLLWSTSTRTAHFPEFPQLLFQNASRRAHADASIHPCSRSSIQNEARSSFAHEPTPTWIPMLSVVSQTNDSTHLQFMNVQAHVCVCVIDAYSQPEIALHPLWVPVINHTQFVMSDKVAATKMQWERIEARTETHARTLRPRKIPPKRRSIYANCKHDAFK